MIQRTIEIFFKDLEPLVATMVWVYLLAALGFAFHVGNDPAADLAFLIRQAPAGCWATAFLAMALFRLFGLYYLNVVPIVSGVVSSCLGIWLWCLLFFSSAIITPAESMSPLYLVCVACEFWILARQLWDYMEEQHKIEAHSGT